MPAAFDRYARTYSATLDDALRFVGHTHLDFARFKVDRMRDAVARLLGDATTLSFVDLGCGTGTAEALLGPHVASVTGCDLSEEMLAQARERCPRISFVRLDGDTLPFDDGRFDVVFTFVTLLLVAPRRRTQFMAEAARVVRPGGLLFVFEHNPWNPLTQYIARTCALGGRASMLTAAETRHCVQRAGLRVVEQQYYYFFPRFLERLRPIERWIRWLPLGGQYYVVARRD